MRTADRAADAHVFRHVGRQDDRVRAKLQRAAIRHRRAHAEGSPRRAAGGHDAAPPATAHDHRLVGELGPIALLDRGVERVAVDHVRSSGRRRRPGAAASRNAGSARCGAIVVELARQSRQNRATAASAGPRIKGETPAAGRPAWRAPRSPHWAQRPVQRRKQGAAPRRRRDNRGRRRETPARPPPDADCAAEAREREKSGEPFGVGARKRGRRSPALPAPAPAADGLSLTRVTQGRFSFHQGMPPNILLRAPM